MSDQVSSPRAKRNPLAFLSHSSLDKAFVEAVATRLGRVQVIFDKWCFETGDAFINAIPTALDTSSLFVLFASRVSLDSFWVQLEIGHAQALLASAVLRKALVFIIDDSIHHSDLPRWMQGNLIQKFTSPNSVTRIIQTKLDSLRGVKQNEYFFGREQLLQDFGQKLFPVDSTLPPNILVIAGLSGMGRRTFARHVLEDRMSMRMGGTFHLRKGDGYDALHLSLLAETAPLASKESVSASIETFRDASRSERNAELIRLLLLASEGNVAPVIVDDGALIESDGSYTEETMAFIQEIRKFPQLIVVLVQSRPPNMLPSSASKEGICATKVPPLIPEASRQFLSRRFADNQIPVSSEQSSALIPALNGYPPAFNLAASYAREYGLPVLLSNRAILTSFQEQEFADLLAAMTLSNHEWGILRLLAAGMELPVEGIMAATGHDSATIVPSVQHLVDLSLVLNNSGTLAIAGPLTYAVIASKGAIRPNEYALIGKALKAKFWDKQDGIPEYGILESTISALLRGDGPDLKDFKSFVVPSMLLRNARYHYQLRGHDHWLKAQDLLSSLLTLEPRNAQALSLLVKIHVRLRQWQKAEATLQIIKDLALPDRHFLEGFMLWKRKRFSAAVSPFNTALLMKQEGFEIYHGLATCLLRLGKLNEAKKVVQEGLAGRARQNVLLVDLAAMIAIERNELADAEKYIEQLRRLKADEDYHHRAATLASVRHKAREAVTHARKASQVPRARFEVKTTFVNTLIEVREFAEAERELKALDDKYRMEEERQDVLLGLRCKYLLRQGKWSQAEPVWERLNDQDSAVHTALRKEILQQKIADKATSLRERNEASLELLSVQGAPSLELLPLSELTGSDEDIDATEGE